MTFKSMLAGLGMVLVGSVVAPLALIVWRSRQHPPGGFSPMGMVNHLTSSWVFWLFLIVLFAAGYAMSLLRVKHG
jgi:hypothetical protein